MGVPPFFKGSEFSSMPLLSYKAGAGALVSETFTVASFWAAGQVQPSSRLGCLVSAPSASWACHRAWLEAGLPRERLNTALLTHLGFPACWRGLFTPKSLPTSVPRPQAQPPAGPVANPTLWGESSPHSLGE